MQQALWGWHPWWPLALGRLSWQPVGACACPLFESSGSVFEMCSGMCLLHAIVTKPYIGLQFWPLWALLFTALHMQSVTLYSCGCVRCNPLQARAVICIKYIW